MSLHADDAEYAAWFRWTPSEGTVHRCIWFTREQSERIRAHPEFEVPRKG